MTRFRGTMAEVKPPIFTGIFEDVSGVGMATADKRIINGFVEKVGGSTMIHKRPAFPEVTLFPSAAATASTYGSKNIYGVHALGSELGGSTSGFNKFFIVAADSTDGYVYEGGLLCGAVTSGVIKYTLEAEHIYPVSSAETTMDRRSPRFAEGTNSTNVAVTFINILGAVYQYAYALATPVNVTASTASSAIIDVAFINKRLLQIVLNSDNIYYSAVGDPTDFTIASGGGSFAAETQSDTAMRLKTNGNDVTIFGAKSVDLYYSSGNATTPFARYNGAEIKVGLAHADALVDIEGTYYFFGSDFAIHKLQGRGLTTISAPIEKYLRNAADLLRVHAAHTRIETQDFLSFSFPDMLSIDAPYVLDATPPGVTFVYHIQTGAWYIWSDTSTIGNMGTIMGTTSPVTGKSYIADNTAQVLLSPRLDTGYSSNKEDLVVTSGNISLDTNLRKSSKKLTGRMKGATGPTIKHRNGPDSDVAWASSTDIAVTVTDASGELMEIRRLGQYRTRQYQLTHTADEPFSFGDMTEEVEVLGS